MHAVGLSLRVLSALTALCLGKLWLTLVEHLNNVFCAQKCVLVLHCFNF